MTTISQNNRVLARHSEYDAKDILTVYHSQKLCRGAVYSVKNLKMLFDACKIACESQQKCVHR